MSVGIPDYRIKIKYVARSSKSNEVSTTRQVLYPATVTQTDGLLEFVLTGKFSLVVSWLFTLRAPFPAHHCSALSEELAK
jgi:hypothetical protein